MPSEATLEAVYRMCLNTCAGNLFNISLPLLLKTFSLIYNLDRRLKCLLVSARGEMQHWESSAMFSPGNNQSDSLLRDRVRLNPKLTVTQPNPPSLYLTLTHNYAISSHIRPSKKLSDWSVPGGYNACPGCNRMYNPPFCISVLYSLILEQLQTIYSCCVFVPS